MVINPLLCGGKLGKDSILISLDRVVITLQVHRSENLIKVFMEALMTDGGLQQN
jgi:hypothetical protein